MTNYLMGFLDQCFQEWTKARDVAKSKGHDKIVDAISTRENLLATRAKVCW